MRTLKFDTSFFVKEPTPKEVYIWGEDYFDEVTEKQVTELLKIPFIYRNLCFMADNHAGYGMPIGGVLAMRDFIYPYGVGNDIGCGILWVETELYVDNDEEITPYVLKNIMEGIYKTVPVGKRTHNEIQPNKFLQSYDVLNLNKYFEKYIKEKEAIDYYKKSLGTLGGGNHFLQISKGDNNRISVMIHTGSRKLGNDICKKYHNLALLNNKLWGTNIPDNNQIALLPVDHPIGKNYIEEMKIALLYAKINREIIMHNALKVIREALGNFKILRDLDIHHNYASLENHFGQNVWVHRKGAIRLRKYGIGIIPGSQGTKSYIVSGEGNINSFCSGPHGAGRKMSRKKANELLKKEECELQMKGIVHKGFDNTFEEAPGAYKDIDYVIKSHKDCMTPAMGLEPLMVVKE